MPSFLIVLPTKNESLVLEQHVHVLKRFLDGLPSLGDWRICIADNGSTDDTPKIAAKLARDDARIQWFHLDESGRGRALAKAWNEAQEDLLCYMDADLSTYLEALPYMLGELKRGAEVVYGSRFDPASIVERSLLREITSRGYNILVRTRLGLRAGDAQCGFKGVTKNAWKKLQAHAAHPGWFFDTELLVHAERLGMAVRGIPVNWIETRNARRKSKVHLWSTVRGYLTDVQNLRKKLKK